MSLDKTIKSLGVPVVSILVAIGPAGWAQTEAPSRKDPQAKTEEAAPKTVPEGEYARLLKGKKLEEGRGFEGVVLLGESMGAVNRRIGPGREDMKWPFWYFYDQGGFQLTVATLLDPTTLAAEVHAIIVAGADAPPTGKGVRIGDSVSAIEKAYGRPAPFDGALVGISNRGRTRRNLLQPGAPETTVGDPPEFKDALFFPGPRMLVAIENGKVARIAVVGEETLLPVFRTASKVGWR